MGLGSYFDTALPLVDKAKWLDTRSHSLNILAGRGLAGGSVVQLFGLSQSRKTTIALFLMRAAQDAGFVSIYFDKEDGFLEHVALLNGLRFAPPRLKLKPHAEHGLFGGLTNAKEQEVLTNGFLFDKHGDTTVEGLFLEAARVCQACKRGGQRPFFVVDSLSVLTTRQEQKKGMKGDTRMTHAKELRKGFRLFLTILRACDGVMVVIDHLKPTGIGGGSATGFFSSTRLRVDLVEEIGVEVKGADDDDAEGFERRKGIASGFESSIYGFKSRHAPNMTIPFVFHYDSGFDRAVDTFWAAQHIGALTLGGAWYTFDDSFPGSVQKFHGAAKWRKFYEKHVEQHADWFQMKMDRFYVDKWKAWCRVGKIDPMEHLAQFGDAVTTRVRADLKALEKLELSYKRKGTKKVKGKKKSKGSKKASDASETPLDDDALADTQDAELSEADTAAAALDALYLGSDDTETDDA